MTDNRKASLAAEIKRVREISLAQIDMVPATSLERMLHPDFRPLRWHLGHIGMFEDWWILQKAGGLPPTNAHLSHIYSTEYPRSELGNLPPIEDAIAFSGAVRDRVLDFLDRADLDADDPLLHDGYIFRNVITHEYQHTETIAYGMQMVDLGLDLQDPLTESQPLPVRREVHVPGGEYPIGRLRDEAHFSYDNEWPRHKVLLNDYYLDDYPVTNAEYLEFIEGGGYGRKELWGPEGWAWRESTDASQPLYWRQEAGGWVQKTILGSLQLPLTHPVMLVSWFEAEAYANFRGKRLPTEAEWEVAACWDPDQGRQLTYPWGDDAPTAEWVQYADPWGWTAPAGEFLNRSPLGLYDMTGNIWEWTSTPFEGYPGFEAYPYAGYSQVWFDGLHRIARGGSFATQAPMLRATFRNWFYPRTRERFIGIRLARDAATPAG